jgi:hypothetical protein
MQHTDIKRLYLILVLAAYANKFAEVKKLKGGAALGSPF